MLVDKWTEKPIGIQQLLHVIVELETFVLCAKLDSLPNGGDDNPAKSACLLLCHLSKRTQMDIRSGSGCARGCRTIEYMSQVNVFASIAKIIWM